MKQKGYVGKILWAAALAALIGAGKGAGAVEIKYEPTRESVRRHRAPEWYQDAKFGIFIHWSLSSVPGYAPVDLGTIWEIAAREGFSGQLKNNPYSEWYLNTMKIPGSPTREYHRQQYGADFPYDGFVPQFNAAMKSWSPEAWAELFREVGARYVVLVSKHHDGFLLWPSARPNPFQPGYFAGRDAVGELSAAVRARGLKMGLYYSGGLDWTFNPAPIEDAATFLANGPTSKEYSDYVNFHFHELIDKYHPSILWNDICYPPDGDVYDLFAYFYNHTPDGAVNDRWNKFPKRGRRAMTSWPLKNVINFAADRMISKQGLTSPQPPHADFSTPEYATLSQIKAEKWECVRGIGQSFGYNRMETEKDYLKADEAVRMLADIVSKNGNLLLDVGPRADGSIPEPQLACLRGIGEWLQVNGEAIYGARPWSRAEGKTTNGVDLRFTRKGDRLYAILMGAPPSPQLEILGLRAAPGTVIRLLGGDTELAWSQSGENLKIALPDHPPASPALVLALSRLPGK